jgi:hypothetical protein
MLQKLDVGFAISVLRGRISHRGPGVTAARQRGEPERGCACVAGGTAGGARSAAEQVPRSRYRSKRTAAWMCCRPVRCRRVTWSHRRWWSGRQDDRANVVVVDGL